MSMPGLTELTAKLKERTGLYKEIFSNAASIEEAVANAASAGYSVTSAELAQAVIEVRGPEVLQLSDADLEQVAGGISPLDDPNVIVKCSCYGA